jgi:hypothetical protein
MSVVLDRLYHLHWVNSDLARSAQPYLGFYRAFLRPHGFQEHHQPARAQSGFRLVAAREAVSRGAGDCPFRRQTVLQIPAVAFGNGRLFDAFEQARTPFLVKCSGGQDRTSLAAALYLLERKGRRPWPKRKRQFAFWPYLHRPNPTQLWLKEFPAYARASRGAVASERVGRNRYQPQAFAEFLTAKGCPGASGPFRPKRPG